jgi:3-oxoacyl-[acyl-carrier protein] reductase
MARLEGKVALVTGAGRGIGQAIAVKLAREGARIVLNDLDEGPAGETLDLLEKLGAKAVAVNGDITAPGFADRFIAAALENFGGLDIIVNSAGYSWDALIHKTTDEQFDAMLDIHVRAPFKILRAAATPIREMAKREAEEGRPVHRKVVNISSIGGLYGNAGQVGYAAGKTALIGMTKTLAKEWGRYKVNVNCVAFGLIQTRMTEAFENEPKVTQVGDRAVRMGVPPEFLQSMNKMIPLGRAGTPEDAAGAVFLFCIPESDYITGEVLLVSGGLVI